MDRTRPTRATAAALVVILVAWASGATAAAGAPAPGLGGQSHLDPDTVVLRVELHADGSAAWRVAYRVRLDDENTARAFESFRRDVEANRSRFANRFEDRMRPTVRSAENATGREMGVRNVTVSVRTTALPQEYGVVAYAFDWEGFAVASGTDIRSGDAIRGLFLDGETTLIVAWPRGYEPVETAPAPDERRDRAAVWHGPLDFAAGEPLVRAARPSSPAGTAAGSAPPTTSTGRTTTVTLATTRDSGSAPAPDEGTPGAPDRGTSYLSTTSVAVIGVVALGVLGGAIGWAYTRRARGERVAAGGPTDGPSEDLLSNEERVMRVLEDRGGRMKQQAIAAEFGWTDAKTSQVIGDLREADQVEVFRLGRENVVSLPDDGGT